MNVKPEITIPVRNEIIIPKRPIPLIAPKRMEVHVITQSTIENKLKLHEAYFCNAFDEYLVNAQFQRDIIRYISDVNELLDYYESTINKINKGD